MVIFSQNTILLKSLKKQLSLDGEKTKDPAFGMDAIWLPEDRRSEAESAGYVIVDPPTIISTHITEIIKNHAAELLDRQAVDVILNTVKKKNPVLDTIEAVSEYIKITTDEPKKEEW